MLLERGQSSQLRRCASRILGAAWITAPERQGMDPPGGGEPYRLSLEVFYNAERKTLSPQRCGRWRSAHGIWSGRSARRTIRWRAFCGSAKAEAQLRELQPEFNKEREAQSSGFRWGALTRAERNEQPQERGSHRFAAPWKAGYRPQAQRRESLALRAGETGAKSLDGFPRTQRPGGVRAR